MNKHIYTRFCAIVIFFALSYEQAKANNELPATRFKKMLDSIHNRTLLDVRTLREYMAGHLQGAQNIDWNCDTFEVAVSHIDRSKPVFVYCLTGIRCVYVAEKLHEMGFTEVYRLRGGIFK
jgi:thioredoxin 1